MKFFLLSGLMLSAVWLGSAVDTSHGLISLLLSEETKPQPISSFLPTAAGPSVGSGKVPLVKTSVYYIESAFENGSPIWYEIDADGHIRLHLLYDHEFASPNRAALHFHFRVHAEPDSDVILDLENLDNVWNSQNSMVANSIRNVMSSEDGKVWQPHETEVLPDNRVWIRLKMPGPQLYVARVDPYRLSDLEAYLESIRNHPLVEIKTIGKTVEGRSLEMVRIGNPQAPYRIFVRGRAHPWEAGSSWVAQGLMKRLLSGDEVSSRCLEQFVVYVMPMANKDGVVKGRSRFNMLGRDLNRNWDLPASREGAPENFALEQWLQGMVKQNQKPHFAIELHNDGNGKLHISRPPVENLDQHLERMKLFEQLLRKHTWFTEGSTESAFRNSGTLGDGWLSRFGVDAVVHELNCNYIAGLAATPDREKWQQYGGDLMIVFEEYFKTVQPE